MPGVGHDGLPDHATAAAVREGVGALHSVVGMPASAAARYHHEIRRIAADAGVAAPLVSGNLESGIGYSLGRTGTDLPYPRGIGIADDVELAYRVARTAAEQSRAVGYDWTFSPTVDVLTTSRDPILGVRAFAVDAERTAALGAAQVRGFRDGGILASAKHFPGHGDSIVDSHLGLPVIDRDADELESVHLPPFAAAIAAGVQTIMVGHVVLRRLGEELPASISPTVNKAWLRDRLGFDGVIISDSLRMAAIAARWTPAEAAVLALAAGADVANSKCGADALPSILDAVVEAVRTGAVDEASIDASVARLNDARRSLPPVPAFAEAARLDAPATWNDVARARTVDVAGTIRPVDRVVVVGDHEFAGRLADALQVAGAEVSRLAEHPSPATLALAAHASDAPVLPVLVPPTAVDDAVVADIRATVAAAAALGAAATVVNGVLPADGLRIEGGPVVVAPAVDAFGICTQAAVDAVIDRLRSATS
jgi:beta-glucosidase-like glycosyl hydrolase